MENPEINKQVEIDNPMKEWLVNYVGEAVKPENNQVTVGMIVEQMMKEFPEFLMVIAEENFIRGYQQAFADLEEHQKQQQETQQNNG
jgi:hypothetical protein